MIIPEAGSPGLVWLLRDVSGTQAHFIPPSLHPSWQASFFTERSGRGVGLGVVSALG